MEEIDKVIGKFWASQIENINIDFFALKASIDIKLFTGEETFEKHQIIFDGVSSFYFSNGSEESRFNTGPSELLELSEIHYLPNLTDHMQYKSDKQGLPNFDSNPNFYLEIWTTVLPIEARSLIIDRSQYHTNSA